MQKTLLIAFLAFTIQLNAQEKIAVNAGKGFKPIKLGMKEKKLRKKLGDDLKSTSYQQEMKVQYDFNPASPIDSMTMYVLGFDKCLEAGKSIEAKWPLYKMYLRNNRVRYITLTSYRDDGTLPVPISLNKELGFFDSPAKAKQVLGEDFMLLPSKGYTIYCYYKKGVVLMFEENELRVVSLFKPVPDFPEMIANRKTELNTEFKRMGGSDKGVDSN